MRNGQTARSILMRNAVEIHDPTPKSARDGIVVDGNIEKA